MKTIIKSGGDFIKKHLLNYFMLIKTNRFIQSVTVLLILLIAYLIFNQKRNTNDVLVKSQFGYFDITVTVTGELLAENSEIISAPQELRTALYGFSNIKIQDIVPEGTIVDSGDYVAMLDRSDIAKMINDKENDIVKSENEIQKLQMDSASALRESYDNILNQKSLLEEKKESIQQLLYEPPATIKAAQSEVDKLKRDIERLERNYIFQKKRCESGIWEVRNLQSMHRSRLSELKVIIEKFEIRAPKKGMVIYYKEWGGQKRKVNSLINAWDLNVATLPDMSRMISKTYVNEIDVSKVKVGQNVIVSLDAFPDKKYKGRVISVANVGEQVLNSTVKAFEVLIKILDKSQLMKPGMTTSNRIIISKYDEVLFLPIEAIVKIDSLDFVFQSNGIKQQIECGESNENFIIVKRGISKDDVVYLNRPANMDKFRLRYIK